MGAKNLAEMYKTPLLDWDAIEARLRAGVSMAPGTGGPDRHSSWLVTINADGSPHVTGIGALWADDCFWFETGRDSRKGRNLARDPRCTLSLATQEFDLVVDGDAAVVTAEFSAPSAGPPPWHVYRLTPRAATAVATVEPGGATRWRF